MIREKIALLSLATILTGANALAQNKMQVEKVIKQVEQFEQIDSLKRVHNRWDIYGETLSSSDTINFPFIKNPVVGEIYKMTLENRNNQKYLVKVLKKETQQLCRVQHIFLDGEKYSEEEIDSIRTDIHRRHFRGEKFSDLVKEFNMDGGPGDIGWFSREMVISEFFDPILEFRKDEVFNISIPKNNWYYVVKKTEDTIIRKLFYTLWMRYE